MTTTFVMGTEYVEVTCGHKDHGPGDFAFAMTRRFYDETRRTGRNWFCPVGHQRMWTGKTTEAQLEDARTRESALRDQLTAAVREAETVRVALLRDRQRFANGVCPCCNRSFGNVRRHMSDQHPDYDVTRVKAIRSVRFKCSCGRSFDTFHGLRIHQGSQRRTEGQFAWDKPDTSRYWAHLTETGATR